MLTRHLDELRMGQETGIRNSVFDIVAAADPGQLVGDSFAFTVLARTSDNRQLPLFLGPGLVESCQCGETLNESLFFAEAPGHQETWRDRVPVALPVR